MRRASKIPESNVRHYCRSCDAVFEPGETEPAHTTAQVHVIREHERTRLFSRCSRYCMELEQPEERTDNRKLYGVGSSRNVPTRSQGYDDLFPKEEGLDD